MNNRTLRRLGPIFFGCGIMAALTLLAAAARAAVPPAEKLLPADTLLVVSVPDWTKAKAVFEKSPRGRLLNDPAMKPIRDKFMEKFQGEFLAPLERELGVKLGDYSELAQGQFTFAITQEGWNGQGTQMPALLLLLDTRDKSGQLKTNLATLRKKWVEAGKAVRTEKIRGIDFMVMPMSTNDIPKTIREFFPQHQEVQELGKEPPPKSDKPTELYIGQFETLLIMGDAPGAVEKIVAHLTGGSVPALADEALFEADRLALFRDTTFFSWLNAKRFVDVLQSMPPDAPNPEAPSLMPQFDMHKVLLATGLSGLKTVAMDSRITEAGSLGEVFFGAPESVRQGLLKILAVPAKDSSPPPFVPADAVKFQRFRVDGPQAMATLEKMLNDISPQLANVFNFFLSSAGATEKEKDPDFDLKKNLFGGLGDDFIIWLKAPRRNADGSGGAPPSIVLMGSPNPEKLTGALKMLMSISPGTTVKERDFLGHKIYSLEAPTRSRDPRTNTPSGTTSFAAGSGYVALSQDTALLEAYLRSSDGQLKPLRELPGLTEAAQTVGGQGTGIFTYENETEMMRVAFEKLRLTAKMDTNSVPDFDPVTSSMPFAHPEKSFGSWVDFSLLPDFDRVAKYFSFTVASSSATANGICFRAFSPTPPALR